MKTISQIAKEIGVTKQAVHQKIKKEPLSSSLRQFTSTVVNTLMIDVDGEMLIKSTFHNKTVKMVDGVDVNEPSTNRQRVDGFIDDVDDKKMIKSVFDSEIIKLLQDNILILQEQLKIKDKQIEELTATVRIQSESINAVHHNQLAETIIDGQANSSLSKNSAKKKPISFWQFWKKSKNI